jgi:diacylglycerol kinase family enzyme
MGGSVRPEHDRIAVVVNGNAKGVTDDLVSILDQIVQSGDLFVSRSLDEGRRIAATIVERGYPTVLTGGGDGTFVQTVTWILEEAERQGRDVPRFGLLRLGTGNALAWVLGAQNARGRGVVPDLARLRREAGSRSLRLLTVEGHLTPFAGVGADAAALQNFSDVKALFQSVPVVRRFATGGVAHFVSFFKTAPAYMGRPKPRIEIVNEGAPAVRVGVSGQPVGQPLPTGAMVYAGTPRMVIVSTIPYWGFGARIFPFADDREDRFQLRVVDITPVDVAVHIRSIWRGTYRSSRIHDFLVDAVRISSDPPSPVHVGGDPIGERSTVSAALADRPIQVVDFYAPPKH